ncbi:MAG: 1-acyl-sn-glycerol-3-phosphate acyltransferase [Sandaracinaceae bacterium]|nr:1-acyl-sn-glycerol-3-phosphate acyltransferase [Myxococcales bacterium]MCB9662081.1 1-acyl-sn-glycerol-3-phosphate acyltransferase [Sandaracinaceae bacterium]
MPALYSVARRLFRRAASLYFVDVQVEGADNVPREGPVVFAANHPNSLMDTVLLGSQVERDVHYLARSGLFAHPLAAAAFRAAGVIPVQRAQDQPGHSTAAEGGTGAGGDAAPPSPGPTPALLPSVGAAAGPETSAMGLDNDAAFAAAFDALERGRAVGIFPEGQNAPTRHVRAIKTGVARIALGAEARHDFTLGVVVVPVGLNYVERERFHTAALVRFGEALRMSDYAVAYQEDPRAAVRALTDDVQAAMREVAVHVPREEQIDLAEDLYALYGAQLRDDVLGSMPDLRLPQEKLLDEATARASRAEQLGDRFLAEQLIADAFDWFEQTEPERAAALAKRVHAHKRHLDQLRLRGDFAARPGKQLSSRAEAVKLALYAVLLGPVAAYGLAHNFVPYRLTRIAARRAPDEPIQAISALAAGLFAFGLAYALFGWLAWHGSASLLGATLYVSTLPFAGFWFFRYRRRLGIYAHRIVARTLFRTRPKLYRGLLLEREQLLVELDAVRVAYQRALAHRAQPPS